MNCSYINESIKASIKCSPFSWGVVYANGSLGNCSEENYTGSVCRQQLLEWQECAVEGPNKDVFLDLTLMELSQQERERDVAQFLHFLREFYMRIVPILKLINKCILDSCIHAESFGSDHCQRAAGLLVCQSYFPLCDACQSGHSYLASREECERISMVECEEEWTSAREYGIPLPNCTDLPDQVTSERFNWFRKIYLICG